MTLKNRAYRAQNTQFSCKKQKMKWVHQRNDDLMEIRGKEMDG